MAKKLVGLGQIENYYGIYIRNDSEIWGKKDVLILGLYDQFNMQEFFDGKDGNVYFNPLMPLLKITMPCGESVVYRSLEEIPSISTLCPCGNPKHWLIKYEADGNG